MPSETLFAQLEQIFASRQRQLYVAAISITRDRASAEDVVFDSMLAVSELRQAPDDILAYLFRTVRNKALHNRKYSQRFSNQIELSSFIDSNSQTQEQQVFTRQVVKVLETVEGDQQQVLIMKLFGDLSFKEIAEITATNPNTVASWYRRGIAALKEKLHEPALR